MRRVLPFLLLLAAGRAGASVLEIEDFRLPNGMRVVLAPDAAVPVVTLSMAVPVGARQEERGRSGFAHLFEHLMFEGSAHVRKGEFDKILESHGAENNAWTALDYTFYYETLPAHALPVAIWLDADRLSALSVSEEGRRNQVAVVKEEKRLQVFNEPYGPLLWIDIASRTFSNWANIHDTYGSFEDLSRASLTDVRRFFDEHYAPGNVTLVLVGDFDPEGARKLVTRYFGWIPNRGRPPISGAAEPEQDGERRFTVRDKHARVGGTAIVYNGMPERGSRDYYALALLGRMLFTGKSARLYQLLVKEKQTATAIDEPFAGGLGFPVSGWDSFRSPGLFGGFILRKPGVATEDIRRLVFGELASIVGKGVAPDDLTRVKTKFRSDWIVGLQTTLGRASLLARAAVLDGEPGAANGELERFLAVTPEEIQEAAAKYLSEKTANVFDLIPTPAPVPKKQPIEQTVPKEASE